MKKEIIDIPEVNLSDVKEFWVLGSQYKDGILGEYNLKTDLKAALYPPLVKPAYESVDLGLPSGTLWATMNVGATKPQQYGDYYAWGEVEIKDETAYTYNKYRFYPGNVVDEYTKYNSTDNKMTLDLTDDVANVVMGGKWHMPSRAQLNELTANTTSSWTTDYMVLELLVLCLLPISMETQSSSLLPVGCSTALLKTKVSCSACGLPLATPSLAARGI